MSAYRVTWTARGEVVVPAETADDAARMVEEQPGQWLDLADAAVSVEWHPQRLSAAELADEIGA